MKKLLLLFLVLNVSQVQASFFIPYFPDDFFKEDSDAFHAFNENRLTIPKGTAQALTRAITNKDPLAFQQALKPVKNVPEFTRQNFFSWYLRLEKNFLFEAMAHLPSAALGLIRLGANVHNSCSFWKLKDKDKPDWGSLKPIHVATLLSHHKTIRRLLKAGSSPNENNADDFIKPLHLVKKPRTVAFLIKMGAHKEGYYYEGETPLHGAQNSGVALALLAAGANVNVLDFNKQTPLHATPSREVASTLLAAGAKKNALDKEGNTPLHAAALTGNIGVAQLLLHYTKAAKPCVSDEPYVPEEVRES